MYTITIRLMTICLLMMVMTMGRAQSKSDTVIVNLASSSKIIFTVTDRSDLEVLKHYDFKRLFDDIIVKLEKNDSLSAPIVADEDSAYMEDENNEEEVWSLNENEADTVADDDDEDWDHDWEWKSKGWGKTWQSFNFDLGTNNYLSDGKFPDSNDELYSVRPWGSWYVAINSIQRTRVSRNFFLEWGLGMSWYNFKFQHDNILIQKDDNGVTFVEDMRDVSFRKSKLTANYINAYFIPVFDFSDRSRKPRFWDGHHDSFRIGLGPYAGYRIGSHSKLVYKDDGREKDKDRDNFYLENFRYGLRFQVGFRSTDLFFNYDLNELFADGRGPSLNAFSFGVVF